LAAISSLIRHNISCVTSSMLSGDEATARHLLKYAPQVSASSSAHRVFPDY
jgi:hypothetical protein